MDGSQMSEFEFARAAPKCEHDPPEADRIGAERSLPANRRRTYWALSLPSVTASLVIHKTERAEPRPELVRSGVNSKEPTLSGQILLLLGGFCKRKDWPQLTWPANRVSKLYRHIQVCALVFPVLHSSQTHTYREVKIGSEAGFSLYWSVSSTSPNNFIPGDSGCGTAEALGQCSAE